jgi:hypothetical protein
MEFIDELQHAPENPYSWWGNFYYYGGNEVMLKERIAPSFFTGIVVSDYHTRSNLLNYLRAQDLTQLDGLGKETILGMDVDQFVKVAHKVSEVYQA